jgi:hypothetical protein
MGVQLRSKPFSEGAIMAGCHRDLMDGEIQVGDVVVSHVNGTFDFYSIATVLSAIGGSHPARHLDDRGRRRRAYAGLRTAEGWSGRMAVPRTATGRGNTSCRFLDTYRARNSASSDRCWRSGSWKAPVIGDCRGAATAPYRRVPASRRVPPAAAQTRLSDHAPAHLRSSRNQRNH